MKVLWIVNTIFPDAADHIGVDRPFHGGWMYGLARDLSDSGVHLGVAAMYSGSELKCFMSRGIKYYLIPRNRALGIASSLKGRWNTVAIDFSPDLVHIHGTEYEHGLALMDVHPELKYIISIQGLVSVYYRYYFAGLCLRDILCNLTFRDLLRRDTLFHARRKLYQRGLTERKYVRRADLVIGRTDWDRTHVEAIHPAVRYHFCNESLRDEFYESSIWDLARCQQHSIFVSQGAHPIKGLHQLLRAVALLIADYPDLTVEVAGPDITRSVTWQDKLRRTGYGRYIFRLMRALGLTRRVKFLGPLSAYQMREAYLRAHVFVCPSSIENSPNSLGEAQILGVPCIATYAGGIPSMVAAEESVVLYRFEEQEMLAKAIRRIFSDPERAYALSREGVAEASARHARGANLRALRAIYKIGTAAL